MSKKRLKLGLALGGGTAKGYAHIGVLKVLHKHHLLPEYIAGTSIGSVIGAAYAAGRAPEEIEEYFKQTDWKKIINFAVPKTGLIRGRKVENTIRLLVKGKTFERLRIPLSVVAYNLSQHERAIFQKGDLASAVRASISVPGIFSPKKIGNDFYIDGAVSNPTPYDVVQQMGAKVIIAVDLLMKEKTAPGPKIKKVSLLTELKHKLIRQELVFLKNVLFPEHWPLFLRNIFIWIFDKILYPARILKILAGRDILPITKTMFETMHILSNNLARQRMSAAPQNVLKIIPVFQKTDWFKLDQVENFVKIGERVMEKNIPQLKKMLNIK